MAELGVKIYKSVPEISAPLERELPSRTYVLYLGREIIGQAQILEHPDGFFEFGYLAITPQYRGRGYGAVLTRFALYEHPAPKIYALTIIPEFFEKLNFVRAEYPPFVDHTDPACLACDPAKCTALTFTKPADLVRYATEEKLMPKYERDILLNRNFMGSEFSAANEKTWIYAENIYFLAIDNYIFLVSYPFDTEPFGVVCPYENIPDVVLDKYFARLKELNIDRLTYVNAQVCRLLHKYSGKDKLVFQENRGNFDYLYKVSDFAQFPGSKFADKRNRLKKFLRNNSAAEIIEYSPKLNAMFFNFAKTKFAAMGVSIISEEVLRLGLEQNLYRGFMVKIGRMEIGLLLYSELNPDTIIVHFELIDETYDGIAQFMNNHLGKTLTGKYLFINREQDLDIPGLRRSKLSYNPYRLVKKYSVGI